MGHYTIKNIDPEIWKRAKVRAAQDGRSVRDVLITCLTEYGQGATMPAPTDGTTKPANQ